VVLQKFPPGPAIGLVGVLGLLEALDRAFGLSARGWFVGLACGVAVTALLAHGLVRASRRSLLPADRVTLARAVFVCGVAALTADAADGGGTQTRLLVTLSAVALSLDAVDGWVARRTGTVSALGARFDMETDALLILALSVHVSRDLGWWVMSIGLARYALLLVGVASRWAPWLRGQVAPRRWRKLVAAYQGVVLTAATAQVVPVAVATTFVAAGLALLLVSFGTEVATLRRQSVRAQGGTTRAYAVPPVPLDGALSQVSP
jgi:phosphatidylglycerophosphate synthase